MRPRKIDNRSRQRSSLIDPFWAIRCGLEMYSSDGRLEDVEPMSGKKIRVTRDVTGAAAPAENLYTIIFEQKVRDNDLLGMSCYMPDWRIPGHGAEQEHRVKLDDLFAELEALP